MFNLIPMSLVGINYLIFFFLFVGISYCLGFHFGYGSVIIIHVLHMLTPYIGLVTCPFLYCRLCLVVFCIGDYLLKLESVLYVFLLELSTQML